jgi:acylphosphatase|tara:strand:+ start:1805 stop:2077 length:273 start_codon:yes stop_codon:yes gene_type:complete
MFRIEVLVSGDVQGVWFRISTQHKANELGLKGWVKNLFSNAVEIKAEGTMEDLSLMIGWLQEGPPNARVEKLSINWDISKNEFVRFEIKK